MGHLTEAQYKIIADRMIEEHRKYGDRLRHGHWADVAARKVASHIADFRECERMFTESEVRAMLNGVAEVVGIGGRAVIEHGSDTEIDKWAKALDKLRSSVNGFGILDPA